MNKGDVNGIYKLRILFEPELAASGVAERSDDEIEMLASILRASSVATTVDERMSAHRQFHLKVLEPAMSEWDLRIWDYLFTANERYARLLFAAQVGSGQENETQRAHEEYLKNWDSILSMLDREEQSAG
jgi:DNA-binding GntR family transcriptional regulator